MQRGVNVGMDVREFTVDAQGADTDRWDDLLAVKPGDRIEAVMVPGSPWVMQLGGRVTAHFVSLLLCAAAAVIVVGVYRLQLRTKGPWYLRKRVDMRGDGPANPADLPEA